MVLTCVVEFSPPVVVLPGRSVVVVFANPVVVSSGADVVELIWTVVLNTSVVEFMGVDVVILMAKLSAFKMAAVKMKARKNICREFIAK